MREPDRSGNLEKPMIVFAGRSNVGKSSMIRALTGKKVRVGKKPGSTRWEFMIDYGPVTLVDIPGFGYMAGQSRATIEETKVNIVQKLESWSKRLTLAILIIDISLFRELYERWSSRGEIPIDVEFYSFLSEITPNVIVVANKIDKVKSRTLQGEVDYLIARLKDMVPDKEPLVVLISALKKKGLNTLVDVIDSLLMKEGLESPSWAITESS